jgi:deoxyribonuclease V
MSGMPPTYWQAVGVDIVVAHDRPETPRQAIEIQERLRGLVDLEDGCPQEIVTVTGLDVAYDEETGLIAAAAVTLATADFRVVEKRTVVSEVTFPYEPGRERGSSTPLVDDGEVVGMVLRTQDGVKPVYVSVGHKISLDHACREVLRLCPEFRQPETTRHADRLARDALKEAIAA